MQYDISKFEELVNEGYLRKSEKGGLVLYGYTDKCTFDRHWNEYTRAARGLILNKNTGECVAKPFPKFFNLGEMEETFLANLHLDSHYTSWEKVDGSLGIIFNHEGEWHISTRGSFYSDQAVMGADLLKKYVVAPWLPIYVTLLVEIVYPENKIIVNYGQESKLVILGAFDRETGLEFGEDVLDDFSRRTHMPIAESYNYSVPQMIELQKTLPKDKEGFVVRFEDGLRVKIKGEEYMRIAKMIAHMSPISFWESMQEGVVNRQYLAQLPEEFKAEYEPIVEKLESQFLAIHAEVAEDFARLPLTEHDHRERAEGAASPETRKKIGLFLSGPNDIRHKSAMFSFLLSKFAELDKYVMKQIRPDGNALRSIE